jgi:putative salt-induced outer membrane protein
MHIISIMIGVLFGLSLASTQAQTPETRGSVATNEPPISAGTNAATIPVTTRPPASTNAASSSPGKPTPINSGAALLGSLCGQTCGKFSISGRTLRLPSQDYTARADGDWRRHLDFGMNQSKGNTDTLRYSLGLDAVQEKDLDLFRIQAKGVYGESSGTKDTENADAAFRYERLLTERIYALGNLEWITDTIAELRYRGTVILSPGLRLIRTENTLLNLEVGAGYIEEKKASEENGYMAGRAAATVERVVNAHVLIWCTGEYLPKLGDTAIYFINAEAGIASYITRDLSLNVMYQERYDSAPVEGKNNSDSILSTTVSLSF